MEFALNTFKLVNPDFDSFGESQTWTAAPSLHPYVEIIPKDSCEAIAVFIFNYRSRGMTAFQPPASTLNTFR